MSATAEKLTKSSRRKINGVVVSTKMDKTIVVEVTLTIKHPVYKKYYKKNNKFKAHDESNQCEVGDSVEIIESRPISKHKNFSLVRIVEKVKKVGDISAASPVEG